MEGSWSDDETGPSGAAMKLAFSPGKASDARTPTGGGLTPEAAGARVGAGPGAGSGVGFSSSQRWQHPFSPVKTERPGADDLGDNSTPSLGSLAPSANGGGAVPMAGSYVAASPEQHSLLSVRDLMDQGTDDEEDDRGSGGGGAGAGATLVRRRHRRPRPELALRTLEMPDTMDVTVVEGVAAVAVGAAGAATAPTPAAGSSATASGKKSARGGRGGTSPNPLVSPTLVGKGLVGDGAGFGSACTTDGRRWEDMEDSSGQLNGSSILAHDTPATTVADDSWVGFRGKGKGRDWGQSTSAFGILAGDEGQDPTAALSRENSGLSGADTSSASDASTSFVKSRPIPDQVRD